MSLVAHAQIKRPHPELHRFIAFFCFADVQPRIGRNNPINRFITALAPKSIQRSVILGFQGVIIGPHHTAEGAMGKPAQRTRVRLAKIKELVPKPMAAMARQ